MYRPIGAVFRPLTLLTLKEHYIRSNYNRSTALKLKQLEQQLEFERPAFVGNHHRIQQTLRKRQRQEEESQSNQLIAVMVLAQLDLCVLCGKPLIIDHSLPSDHPMRHSYDHVTSRNKGGKDRGNRLAAHRECNSRKSNRDPTGCELIWLQVVNEAIKVWEQVKMQSYLSQRRVLP